MENIELKKIFVKEIFRKFNEESIPYVFFKNYQNFPVIGNDIDLVIDNNSVAYAINIIKLISKKHNFNLFLTHKEFFSTSSHNLVINICVQWQIEKKTINCTRIEFMDGLYSSKSSVYTAHDLLKERIFFNGIYIPTYEKQLVILILTVLKNIHFYNQSYNSLDRKASLYVERIKALYLKNSDKSINELKKKFGFNGTNLIRSLLQNDIFNFINYASKAKNYFFVKEFIKRPHYVLKMSISKFLADANKFFFLRGGVEFHTILSPHSAHEVKHILIDNFVFRECLIVSIEERKRKMPEVKYILRREGLVIYTDKLDITTQEDSFAIALNIIKQMANQYELT